MSEPMDDATDAAINLATCDLIAIGLVENYVLGGKLAVVIRKDGTQPHLLLPKASRAEIAELLYAAADLVTATIPLTPRTGANGG